MKSKIEEKLDKEFEELGIKPRIFHFVSGSLRYPYAGITIVDTAYYATYGGVLDFVKQAIDMSRFSDHNNTSELKALLNSGAWGVAICDKRDTFNRKRGRVIAKGRLLKRLKGRKQ